MRELKPRAWSKSHSAYCDFVTLDETGAWVGWFKRCGIYLADKDIVVELPTGLKDKNGKEIYEGDIVGQFVCGVKMFRGKTCGRRTIWQVRWNEEACCFELHYLSGGLFGDSLMNKDDEFEVIGNIHENPELLGGTNATNKEEE